MALHSSREGVIEHLRKYYAEDQTLVVSIWSADDILDEDDEDTKMDIWADVADRFADKGFDYPTELLYDNLNELIYSWQEENK